MKPWCLGPALCWWHRAGAGSGGNGCGIQLASSLVFVPALGRNSEPLLVAK